MQASYTSTANKARQCRAEAGLPDTKSAVNEAQQSQDEAKSTGCTSIDGLENACLHAGNDICGIHTAMSSLQSLPSHRIYTSDEATHDLSLCRFVLLTM
ncbi:hypothetical protein HBI42_037110 [Parastagonospora nodorum]|nr:hypothetical protein HBI43_043430 [Parastagonospora nodorum]KAH6269517.1 hypothetical protein HBI42_037110 [Parastagonospora nodorum]